MDTQLRFKIILDPDEIEYAKGEHYVTVRGWAVEEGVTVTIVVDNVHEGIVTEVVEVA